MTPPKPKHLLVGRGRPKGVKNKTTVQREAYAAMARRRSIMLEEARANGMQAEIIEAAAKGQKLMKEIGFDFARMFAGLAAFYQPYPQWTEDPETGKSRNANPNFDEAKFKEYSILAADTASKFASYESPKLSAVMVASGVVSEIEVVGGLPDDQDGSFKDAGGTTIDGELAKPGADPGQGGPPDVPPEAGPTLPDAGEAEGGPLRKAVG